MECAFAWQVPVETLRGRKRTRHVCAARRELITRLSKEVPSLSSVDIGKMLGRHHSTILWNLGRLANRGPR